MEWGSMSVILRVDDVYSMLHQKLHYIDVVLLNCEKECQWH